MLSIGKLGAGHHAYYELSVASGADDYYTGDGEARGWYLGRGADALDLDGEVEAGDLKHLFRGTHPRSGDEWVRRRAPDRQPHMIQMRDGRVVEGAKPIPTAAFDLTFSAPKSVSVLWALCGDDEVRRAVRAGHETAVRAAFDYLERTACVTRRGAGGVRHLRGEGFVAAAFHHRVSRAVDPQLHTHVLVANATRAEGRYTALHGALLYREAKTAGYLYHAALRAQLTRSLGVEWRLDATSPHPEIVGVDVRLRALFSKRAEEIAQQLDAAGHSGARAANAAAIDTRAAKLSTVHEGVYLWDHWASEARGIDGPSVLDALGRAPDRYPVHVDTWSLAREIAGEAFAPTGLTANQTTFHRRDLIQLVCERSPRGASVKEIEQITDRVLDDHNRKIVALHSGEATKPEGDAVRADGVALADGRDTTAYTTRELLEAELTIIDTAQQRATERVAMAKVWDVQATIDERGAARRLSAEQQHMVVQVTMSGAGMEFVVGLAGAGKTTSLAIAHDAWQRSEIEVRGTATALNAAKNLEAETGIPSETVAMLRAWHDHALDTGDTSKLDHAIPRGGVLIVDEAGMTETRDLAFLTTLTAERETKLVLVGDHRQLPEIGAGGAFRHLVHRFEPEARTSTLTTNRRQVEVWERDALGELRDGSVEQAVVAYAEQDRIVTNPSPDRLREQLAVDWLNARERGRDTAMIAYSNAEVAQLNQTARRLLDERGKLGRERVAVAGREWAVGDELVCTHNQRALRLTNGTRGTVTHVARDGLEIRTTSGEVLRVPRNYLERGHATHGYATTGHKTQGLTVHGEAFVLASDHIDREWLYVTMSRATDQSRVYIDTLDHDPTTGRTLTPQEQRDAAILDLHDLASRSGAQRLAHDHGVPADSQRLDRNDLRRAMQRDEALRERLTRTRGREPHVPLREIGRARGIERGFGRER